MFIKLVNYYFLNNKNIIVKMRLKTIDIKIDVPIGK
jgi:hypothetical protein